MTTSEEHLDQSNEDVVDASGPPTVHEETTVPVNPPVAPSNVRAVEPGDTWARVLGVLAIVFGGFGVLSFGCGGIAQVVMAFFTPSFVDNFSSQVPNLETSMVQLEATRKYIWLAGLVSLALFASAVWLIVGGVKLMNKKASGPTMLIQWSWFKILVSVGYATQQILIQRAASARYEEIVATSDQGIPGGAMMGGMMESLGTIGVLFMLLWQIALPIFLLIYLHCAHTREATCRWKAKELAGDQTR